MTINLSIPKQYHDFLKNEKARTGKTYSEIIRCALDLLMEKLGGAR